jgi:hypothetical protein
VTALCCSKVQTPVCLCLNLAHCPLPAAHCLLPTAHCTLHSASFYHLTIPPSNPPTLPPSLRCTTGGSSTHTFERPSRPDRIDQGLWNAFGNYGDVCNLLQLHDPTSASISVGIKVRMEEVPKVPPRTQEEEKEETEETEEDEEEG